MANYLLVESRDPFVFRDVKQTHELAGDLAEQGHSVTLFLVQNGVLPARPSSTSGDLARVAQRGVEVLADTFSLRERGIPPDGLAPGVAAAPLDIVIDQLAAGAKAWWH